MPDSRGKIRILLANEHRIERDGIRACVSEADHMEIVAESNDGYEAMEQARRHQPDVVVMDERLRGLNGLAATARIRRDWHGARILMLASQDHPDHLVEIIRAGASGCVPKAVAPHELRQAIEKVAAGEMHFGMPETVRYLRRYRPASPCVVAEPVSALTPREEEVLALISDGAGNRQIADRLKIAVRTAETHRERLMRKLDIHDGPSLRAYAAAHQMLKQAGTVGVSTGD